MTSESARIDPFYLDDPPIHLSSTNTPPSEAETSKIRRTLNRGRLHVYTLQIEIDRLHRAIDALRQQRRDIQSKLERHSAILSPLRCFPAEILSAIFWWTLPPANSRTPFYAQSPWNISRVCSRWRGIGIALPALWTHITLH
ncbi:hypothetical protein B0H19DRAFT_958780, partial [Mycena capillaripes]